VVEALVSCGYLGASPDWPTIAMYFPQDPWIVLKDSSLQSFIQHWSFFKGSMWSVCGMCHKPWIITDSNVRICRCHSDITTEQLFLIALMPTFAILQIVDHCIAQTLSHVGENWQVLNMCPPCNYEVCSLLVAALWLDM
jgi:hypothetical protein